MRNAAETNFQHTATCCSVTRSWCKRFVTAAHLAKFRSVLKSIFAMPAIPAATVLFCFEINSDIHTVVVYNRVSSWIKTSGRAVVDVLNCQHSFHHTTHQTLRGVLLN